MVNALIVDDEQNNREALAKMLDQFCPDVHVVDKVGSVAEAIESIGNHDPKIVFLDVEMPGGNGFTLLEQIDNPNFHVIFTTAHAAYAVKAIKFAALDYLLKPINLNELKVATEKAIKSINNGQSEGDKARKIEVLRDNRTKESFDFSKIALPTIDGIEFYKVDDILRCEADRSYCKFYLNDGKSIVVSKPLKEYEDLLSECNFFRIHKSNMVNLGHVTKYVKGKGGYVVLTDGSHVGVSHRKKDDLMNILSTR